jgi:hypothetical protein
MTDAHWLAYAPPGVWSSGPVVITTLGVTLGVMQQYRERGWEIKGPYVEVEQIAEQREKIREHTESIRGLLAGPVDYGIKTALRFHAEAILALLSEEPQHD